MSRKPRYLLLRVPRSVGARIKDSDTKVTVSPESITVHSALERHAPLKLRYEHHTTKDAVWCFGAVEVDQSKVDEQGELKEGDSMVPSMNDKILGKRARSCALRGTIEKVYTVKSVPTTRSRIRRPVMGRRRTTSKVDRSANAGLRLEAVKRAEVVREAERKAREDRQRVKRVATDATLVKSKLFSMFDSTPYLTFKEIQAVVKQPVTHLKRILKEVCVYHSHGEHRTTYSLRPDFQVGVAQMEQ